MRYIYSLYFTMNIATNCGLPLQYPYNNLERTFFILVTYTGDLLFAVAFGMIAANSELFPDHFKNIFRNRDKVKMMLKKKPISSQVRARVEEYFAYLCNSTNSKQSNMKTLANFVSRQIYEDLVFLRAKPFLLNFPIFKEANSYLLLREVAFHLEYVVYMPGDYIIIRNDIGEEMFFIIEGEVNVLTVREDETLATLKSGEYFGEIALFLHTPKRMCSVIAGTYCELYVLRKKFLVEILNSFPIVKEMFLKETERRIAEFQKKSTKNRGSIFSKSPFFKNSEKNTKLIFSKTLDENSEEIGTSKVFRLHSEITSGFNNFPSYKMLSSILDGPENEKNNTEISYNESNIISPSPQINKRLKTEKNTFQNSKFFDLKNVDTFMNSSNPKKNNFYEEKIKTFGNLNDDDFGYSFNKILNFRSFFLYRYG